MTLDAGRDPVPENRTASQTWMRDLARALGPGGLKALALALALTVITLAAWAGGHAAERAAIADLRRVAGASLTLQVVALHAEMQKQSSLPLALAADPEIARVVGVQPEAGLTERVSERLRVIAEATDAAVIYVIRADGLTVAASNSGTPTSFVGNDYGFRPYFRTALADGSGSMFALGTVSGRAGLYLSRRIGDSAGVVVVKVEFDEIEAAWRKTGATVFVTDERGIVLVASEPGWRFRSLSPILPDERRRIRDSLDFGEATLAPLPLYPTDRGPLIRVGAGASPARLALPLDAPVPQTAWRLHTLTPVGAAVRRERVQAQVLAGLLAAAACGGLAVVQSRRRRVRQRLDEAVARRAELEARVVDRTRALSEANDLLRTEIGERRIAEAERERLDRELAQAGRLAALGQFAASMAHEINQPLAAIRSYADNLAILIGRGREDDARENVAAIGRLTERIAGLTRQLKGFARRASGRREPVDLDDVLRRTLEVVGSRAAGEGVVLDVTQPDAVPAVLGDATRLEQVFVNLVQNALDAVAGDPAPQVSIRVLPGAVRVAIEVADNGPGIPDSDRARLFDAFFTTKAEGLGLGLAIARGIVEESGGTLIAAEAPGGGALFRVEMLRATAPAAGSG